MFSIKKVAEFDCTDIRLESDSMFVVNLFKTRSKKVPLVCRIDWAKCLTHFATMTVVVSHIYREGNKVADRLANFGASPQACIGDIILLIFVINLFVIIFHLGRAIVSCSLRHDLPLY